MKDNGSKAGISGSLLDSVTEGVQTRTFTLPEGYELMTDEDLANWKKRE